MKIYLIGMPGSGKSTLGKKVARELNLLFIDQDSAIEQRCLKSVKSIFQVQGEDFFRKVEADLLRELSESNKDFVMATGGGAPCHYNGIDYINSQGTSLFINVSPLGLLERLLAGGLSDRPLLRETPRAQLLASLEEKLSTRLPFYKKAQVELSADDLRSDTLVASLRKIYPQLR